MNEAIKYTNRDGEDTFFADKKSREQLSSLNEDLTTLANNLGGCKFRVVDGVLTVEYEED